INHRIFRTPQILLQPPPALSCSRCGYCPRCWCGFPGICPLARIALGLPAGADGQQLPGHSGHAVPGQRYRLRLGVPAVAVPGAVLVVRLRGCHRGEPGPTAWLPVRDRRCGRVVPRLVGEHPMSTGAGSPFGRKYSDPFSGKYNDPFAGKYQDTGPFGPRRTSAQGFVSGGVMAAGMFLGCSSVIAPALMAVLVLLREVATKTGWSIPASAPSVAVNMVVLAVLAVAGLVAAVVTRRLAARRRTPAALGALATGVVVLGGGLWWVFTTNGLPL